MEEKKQDYVMLDLMDRPAFCVENGIITHVNPAAAPYFVQPGTAITDLVSAGVEDYAAFTEGCLYLTLQMEGFPFGATVVKHQGSDIFILTEQSHSAQLQALALAALELRGPLAGAIAATDQILPKVTGEQNPVLMDHATQLNRRLMQLQRIIGNMSDSGIYSRGTPVSMDYMDICGFLEELLSRVAETLEQAGRNLHYTLPKEAIFMLAHSESLERAVYNMISNAVKFSPVGSTIQAQLVRSGNRIAFSVTDMGSGIPDSRDVFSRYQRQPGLEDGRLGLGLGMVIIRSTAALHGGTVLIDHPEDTLTRVTMTLSIASKKHSEVRGPVLRIDYAGERDHCLLELSDVLPASLYTPENIN